MWGSLFLTTSFIELSSIYTVILILQRTTWYWIMKTAMDIPDKEGQKRLVIVGGGFGGLKLARKLKSNKFQIVLLDKNNHHIFQPLLYQVATAGIEPSAISFPYRKIFKKESISIYVFVKHSKSSRNTICWRLPSARWHTTIWSLPPAATQIILETTGWRNRPWH